MTNDTKSMDMNDKFNKDLVAVQDELLRYAYKLTMDYDEANACGYRAGDLGMIVK